MSNGDFDPVLAEAGRIGRCADCKRELNFRERPRSAFCSEKCRYRYRDRVRYSRDVEAQRERSRRYYQTHREQVLARSQAKRDALRGPRSCSECDEQLEGRARVVCSRTCAERRYRRLHPEAYAAKEARKVARRRERRRESRET